MAVAMGVVSIVLVIIGLLSLYGLRSFLVMGNCAALDAKNRHVSDQISRELRQATKINYYPDASGTTLELLTNSPPGVSVSYTWDADARTLTCAKPNQPQFICLTDCDSWEALFFQNIPQPSATAPFLPATNAAGVLDVDQARIVTLSWKCSRPVTGTSWKTESAQTLQIVLRNAVQP
jgi:hypothetical protein